MLASPLPSAPRSPRQPHSANSASCTLVSAVPIPTTVSAWTSAAARCIRASCLQGQGHGRVVCAQRRGRQPQHAKHGTLTRVRVPIPPTPQASPAKQHTPHAVGGNRPRRGRVVPKWALLHAGGWGGGGAGSEPGAGRAPGMPAAGQMMGPRHACAKCNPAHNGALCCSKCPIIPLETTQCSR